MSKEKLNLTNIREKLANKEGPEYWRSLEEVAETDEFSDFMEAEFPRQAGPEMDGVNRRGFLKLLGASMALAGLAACARPPLPHEKIVPYVQHPEQIVPGKPLFFSTAVNYAGFGVGVLAESHQGRPTKLEGNPDHPASLGATTAITQSLVLNLYDPERSKNTSNNGEESSYEAFGEELTARLEANESGAGVALLTENVTSPTLGKQINDFLAARPEAQWFQYDPAHHDNLVEGSRMAFNRDVLPVYNFEDADIVVSFGGDFLGEGPSALAYSKTFSRRRRVRSAEDDMNRLYAFESHPTGTGALADHRVPLKPSEIAQTVAAVANYFGVNAPRGSRPNAVDGVLFDAMVSDLQENAGRTIVVAGQDQPAIVHAMVFAINEALGNVGSTVTFIDNPSVKPAIHREDIQALTAGLNDGSITDLIVIGANPVHTAPGALNFAEAMSNAEFTAHLGTHRDESGSAAMWHIPQTHFLEAWSDIRAFNGAASIIQPLLLPFYNGKSEHELLALMNGNGGQSPYDIVQGYWRENVTGTFAEFWRESVYRGVVAGSEASALNLTVGALSDDLPTSANFELITSLDTSVYDGRYANNGWLQELPKPFSNLTWDNAAAMAPRTAEALGVDTGDMVTIQANGTTVDAPVLIQPGAAVGAITLTLGYGREEAGRIGNGVGVNAYPLLSTGGTTQTASVSKTAGTHQLVSTQMHHALEGTGEARHIVRTGTLEEFRAEPERPTFAHPVAHHMADLYPDWEYTGYRWGMVIDQSVCTGCNACVTACQAENNIPIVGKDQVAVGREMHWLRIDNYYGGSIDNPEFFHQPMPCQQCEKAPCEPVCPVGATIHDAEGLNVMVYNRCVGTRYCSNNCPYKVRRFNYLQYAELSNTATELSLANNPDVTVRSRGVMEKCTYCTQRISIARIDASNEDRRINDGEVLTACQAACPTEAIVFGDLNDPESMVAQARDSAHNYTLFEELQTFPRTSYLAKVKNPHPLVVASGVQHDPIVTAGAAQQEGMLG